MAIRQIDCSPDVDAVRFGQVGQLICEGDIYVAVGVLCELDELSSRKISEVDSSTDKGCVE